MPYLSPIYRGKSGFTVQTEGSGRIIYIIYREESRYIRIEAEMLGRGPHYYVLYTKALMYWHGPDGKPMTAVTNKSLKEVRANLKEAFDYRKPFLKYFTDFFAWNGSSVLID